jgi:hypothetical protein
MGQIVTGIPQFNAPSDPQGTENQGPNVIFNSNSTSTTSHVIDIAESPIVIRAFNLTSGQTITVNMVSFDGIATQTAPLVLNGHTVELSTTNNCFVLNMSGRFQFVLSGGLGTVSCVWHGSPNSNWSYGLAQLVGAS